MTILEFIPRDITDYELIINNTLSVRYVYGQVILMSENIFIKFGEYISFCTIRIDADRQFTIHNNGEFSIWSSIKSNITESESVLEYLYDTLGDRQIAVYEYDIKDSIEYLLSVQPHHANTINDKRITVIFTTYTSL